MNEEQDNIIVTTPDDTVETVVETKETQESETDESKTDASEGEEQEEDENESEESETSEDDEDKEKEDAEDDEEKEVKPKKKTNGFKKRLNRAKRQREEAQKDKEAAQRDAEYWKQKALGDKDQTSNNVSDDETKSTGKPIPDDFETQEDYLEALTDYKVDKRLASQKEETAQTQEKQRQSDIAKTWQDNVSEFEKNNPDFSEIMDESEDVTFKPAVVETILTSEDGPAILYSLAQNPDEAERISKLSPLAGVKEIGKLEAKLTKSSSKTKTKTNKTTKAPKPIGKKVGGGTRGGATDLYDPDLSQKDYEALRAKQLDHK